MEGVGVNNAATVLKIRDTTEFFTPRGRGFLNYVNSYLNLQFKNIVCIRFGWLGSNLCCQEIIWFGI